MKKTKQEIDKELEALRKMKPNIRRFSFFGDDNHQAIEDQITAISEGYDEDRCYDDFDNPDHAVNAINWAAGIEEESPSESWSPLLPEPTNE